MAEERTQTPQADRQPETDILKREKQAVEKLIAIRPVTEKNAVFERTKGGFLRLTYTEEDGSQKTYPRVAVHRCFPHSDPDHFISIREPETDGKEIGLIEDLGALPQETQEMLREQMALRYFAPKIERVHRIKEEYGYSYWDVLTDRGECRFTVRMGGTNVYAIGPNRYLVNDLDGNRYEIPDVTKLSSRELKLLDLFI